jgi:Rieske Fe-S protein
MDISRRLFLGRLLQAGGALIAAGMFRPREALAAAPDMWIKIGKLDSFPLDTPMLVRDGWRATDGKKVTKYPVHVLRTQNATRVMSAKCTHFGCTVAWQADDKQYHCPCHGAIYDPQGAVTHGPAKKALAEYQNKIEDGDLLFLAPT